MHIDVVACHCQLKDELKPLGLYSPVTSYESLITFITEHPGHDWRYTIDANKMNSELNRNPVETFESGIRKTIADYIGSNPNICVSES